jgi:cell pole-organizing protein PopZ
MEDILASIRRIIAQDQSLFAAEPAPGAADPDEAAAYGLRQEIDAPNEPEAPADPDEDVGAALVSPATDGSVATAFHTLVASRFAQNPDAILAMTREALRPLLANWLDAHLPALVEGLVRAEIERIAKDA